MMSTCFLLVCLPIVAIAGGVEDTPINVVVKLLSDLRDTVTTEAINEASTYKTFACFCKETSTSKSANIRSEADMIDGLSAHIELNTALRSEIETDIAKLKDDHDAHTTSLAESKALCAKEKDDYQGKSADLTKALLGVEQAIDAMENSKPKAGVFLEVHRDIEQTPYFAEAMRLVGTSARSALSALLQQRAKVDPSDPEYQYQSQHIIDILKGLKSEYSATKSELEIEWGKTSNACDLSQGALDEKIRLNAEDMVQGQKRIDDLTGSIASDREGLLEQQASLKDSQLYTKDLTARCEQRARDWDQRSQMRHDELKTLNATIDILVNQVAGNSIANVRAMLLQNKSHAPPLMQNARALTVGRHSFSFLQRTSANPVLLENARRGLSTTARKEKALALLGQEGNRIGSAVLNSLVMHIADDPFKTVKVLIQKLIERLIREAAAEATKKGFCDKELDQSKLQRKYRSEEVYSLLAAIRTLIAKSDKLAEDIATLDEGIKKLTEELAEAMTLRNQSHAENIEIIDKANKGVTALKQAVAILQAFYKKAAKAEVSFSQESPVQEDTAGPGFSGAYKGKQESSVAIFGLLAVLQSDFERTLRVTTKAEEEETAAFVIFKRDSERNIAGKKTKKELNNQDLASTMDRISTAHMDLQVNQNLVDKANKAIEGLKSLCINTGMSYSDRVDKRQEEIAALKRALCILNKDYIPGDCP